MLLDGLPERARDQIADMLEDGEVAVAEEIEWLADVVAPRTPLSRDLVADVLWQRERVLREAAADDFAAPGHKDALEDDHAG